MVPSGREIRYWRLPTPAAEQDRHRYLDGGACFRVPFQPTLHLLAHRPAHRLGQCGIRVPSGNAAPFVRFEVGAEGGQRDAVADEAIRPCALTWTS